jgi:hypothetical protein
MATQWKTVGTLLIGICVGAGIVYVYNTVTKQFYTCTCSTLAGGAPKWTSSPLGKVCPPPSVPADHCP